MSKNASLQAKTNARLAAVQLLYRDAMTGDTLTTAKLMAEYTRMMGEGEHAKKEAELPRIAPDAALLKALVEGVKTHRPALIETVSRIVRDDWTLARMGTLMVQLLLVATYELDAKRERKTEVLIDEYTTLANRLLSEEEGHFVHASLHTLAGFLRS